MDKKLNLKRNRINEKQRNNINGFLFALPWIIGFIIFSVYPLVTSLIYSFSDFSAVKPLVFVGLKNFKFILSDSLFYKSLSNTLFYAVIATPLNLSIALGLALLINLPFKGRTLVRTAFFLPSIIPMIAATMVWIWMFDPTYGYLNAVLGWFGINGPNWLVDPRYTKWALILMGSWTTGTTMLICLAALQDVPKSYYESADLDGANAFNKFFSITLPGVAHVVLYQAILNLINAFQYFTQVYVITTVSAGQSSSVSGGPENSILMYPLYIFHNAFQYGKMGRASALAWVLFLIVAILTFIMLKVTKNSISDGSGGE